MEHEKWLNRIKIVLGFAVLILIFAYTLINIKLAEEPISNLVNKKITFPQFTQQIKNAYVSDSLKGKSFFIDLNGLFARATNRRVYNNTVLMKNGQLARLTYDPIDGIREAETLAALSSYVTKTQNSLFLYVQAPGKPDMNNELLPDGLEHHDQSNADNLLAQLNEHHVNTLDLRPYLSGTAEQVDRYFFPTDHHWTYEGGFVAFQKIMEQLQQLMPNKKLDLTYTDISLWQSHTLKDWFLGSSGKRVGKWYTGVDDLTYFTPTFETSMSMVVPKHNRILKGSFEDVIIQERYIVNPPNYYGDNPYCLYIGGDYPISHHLNPTAPNDLHVLIVKDSFSLPVIAYMSTLVTELDVIDPRHYTENTLTEYIQSTKPDIVLYMMCTTSITNELYYDHVGNPDVMATKHLEKKKVWNKNKLEITAKNNNYRYYSVDHALVPGARYELFIDSVEILEGNPLGICIRLFDFDTSVSLSADAFDLEYNFKEGNGITWVFNVPEDADENVQLLIYAGMPGSTSNTSLSLRNVSLSQLNARKTD